MRKFFLYVQNFKKKNGITLIECLIVIALSCLLLFSTVSAYHQFVDKNSIKTLVEKLIDALEYARETAITSGSTVVFCPNHGDGVCGTHWQKGQLIINENNQQVLRIFKAIPNQYHLLWRSTLGDSNQLRWRSDGFTRGQQGSFFICGQKKYSDTSAQIIILRTGRLRVLTGEIPGCNDQFT